MSVAEMQRAIGEMWMAAPKPPEEMAAMVWVRCDDCDTLMRLAAVKRHQRLCKVQRGS